MSRRRRVAREQALRVRMARAKEHRRRVRMSRAAGAATAAAVGLAGLAGPALATPTRTTSAPAQCGGEVSTPASSP